MDKRAIEILKELNQKQYNITMQYIQLYCKKHDIKKYSYIDFSNFATIGNAAISIKFIINDLNDE